MNEGPYLSLNIFWHILLKVHIRCFLVCMAVNKLTFPPLHIPGKSLNSVVSRKAAN